MAENRATGEGTQAPKPPGQPTPPADTRRPEANDDDRKPPRQPDSDPEPRLSRGDREEARERDRAEAEQDRRTEASRHQIPDPVRKVLPIIIRLVGLSGDRANRGRLEKYLDELGYAPIKHGTGDNGIRRGMYEVDEERQALYDALALSDTESEAEDRRVNR